MAIRVGAAEVQEIMQTTLSTAQIERFVETANLIVEQNLNGKHAYTDSELTEIELYLAAHFCSLRDQRLQQEKIDTISASYQGKTGMELYSTYYGQTAIMLDRFGVLRRLGKKNVASLISVKQFDDNRSIDYS